MWIGTQLYGRKVSAEISRRGPIAPPRTSIALATGSAITAAEAGLPLATAPCAIKQSSSNLDRQKVIFFNSLETGGARARPSCRSAIKQSASDFAKPPRTERTYGLACRPRGLPKQSVHPQRPH